MPRATQMTEPPSRDALARRAFGFQHLLTAYGFSLLNNWTEAEDVVQETILFIDRNPTKYDPGRPLLPWLRGIVRIKCLNVIRARQREVSTEGLHLASLLDKHLDELWDEAAAAEMAKRITALRHCMNELPARACRLLHDFYIERTPGKDLASRERMNFNNLRSQLHRLRNRLRDCVSSRLAEAESAEQEGYWHLLDEYYGHGSQASAGMLGHAIGTRPPDLPAASQLIHYFLDAAAFSVVSRQLRPLVESGAPCRQVAPVVPPGNVRPLVSPGGNRGGLRAGGLPRRVAGSAAAAAAVLLGMLVWKSGQGTPPAAVMTQVSGNVTRADSDSGNWVSVTEGEEIPAGTTVAVGRGSGATLSYQRGRGAEIDLFESSRATLGQAGDPSANLIALDRGTLQATVARQDASAPMRILTPNSETTVLGTTFLVHDGAIEVAEGLVRYGRRTDGQSVEVPAYHRAASSSLELMPIPDPALGRGLVAHWAFDEFEGAIAHDSGGGGHALQITGADWARGREGGSLRLRDMAYATVPHHPSLAITGELSLSAWIRVSRYGQRAGIVGKYAGGDEMDNDAKLDRCYALKLNDGRLDFLVSPDGSRTRATNVIGVRRLPTGVWIHVAAVYRPSESVRLFVSGRLDAVATEAIVPAIAQKPAPLYVGTTYNTVDPANFFSGQIDEVRIYNRALNPDEIRLLAVYR
ncbi:hypothetical protein BH23VER1_BH23VER1_30110 [soil metagenome]